MFPRMLVDTSPPKKKYLGVPGWQQQKRLPRALYAWNMQQEILQLVNTDAFSGRAFSFFFVPYWVSSGTFWNPSTNSEAKETLGKQSS